MTRAKTTVKRIPGPGSRVEFSFGFNPEGLGPERAKAIYEALGQIANNLLTPSEQARLLKQFEAVRRKSA